MGQDSANINALIFGFGHRARHGKDTVAAAIKEARGLGSAKVQQVTPEGDFGRGTAVFNTPRYNIRSYSFAKELKDEVNRAVEMFDKDWATLFEFLRVEGILVPNGVVKIPDWVVMESDPDMTDPLCPYGKYRTLLQWWGSDHRRVHFGENYWVERAAARIASEKPEIALFTDLRFPNEMAFVKEYGVNIKVVRPGVGSLNSHISEEALAHVPDDDWDAVIVNDGSLEDLKIKAVQTFDNLMDKQR